MSDTVADYISANAEYFGLQNVDNIPDYIAENNLYVHPTFFYESVWCLLGFGALYLILRKYRKFSGQLFLSYGVWYGFERAIVEGMRSDSLYIGSSNIRVSQVISFALMLICLILLIVFLIKYTKHPKPIEGIDYFPPKSEKELEEEKRKLERKEIRKKMKNVKIRDGKLIKKDDSPESRSDKNAHSRTLLHDTGFDLISYVHRNFSLFCSKLVPFLPETRSCPWFTAAYGSPWYARCTLRRGTYPFQTVMRLSRCILTAA